jgi:uncharacterized membrane protein HdeD (DUF308 family)
MVAPVTPFARGEATVSASQHDVLDRDLNDWAAHGTRRWWLPLVTGAVWLLFAVIVFRFDYASVQAISVLFGVVVLAAAANELMLAWIATPGWRILRLLVSAAFVVVGVVSFIDPGGTFVSLAAVMSFYFVIRGGFDIASSFSLSDALGARWLTLFIGFAEVLIGFWAAGSWGASAALLVGWVGGVALIRGVAEIAVAFQIRPGHQVTA